MAQEMNVTVKPLVGPSSILLALMASGMNGQQFRFNGYLPIEADKRKQAIRDLESESARITVDLARPEEFRRVGEIGVAAYRAALDPLGEEPLELPDSPVLTADPENTLFRGGSETISPEAMEQYVRCLRGLPRLGRCRRAAERGGGRGDRHRRRRRGHQRQGARAGRHAGTRGGRVHAAACRDAVGRCAQPLREAAVRSAAGLRAHYADEPRAECPGGQSGASGRIASAGGNRTVEFRVTIAASNSTMREHPLQIR